MARLPEKFIERMKTQLPESELEAFFAVYEQKPVKGIRVNTLKCSAEDFEKISPFALSPVAWEENGFYIEEEKVGHQPYHFAGVFYSQEPSAMCAAPMLEVKRGERVLDLCSAPGGKGTQLAARLEGDGLIVLNEPILSRAKILSQNVERMGIRNAVVVSEMPDTLAKNFEGYFDKILVDAPCSGEGMFRKNAEEALTEWSEENVALCAERQKNILNSAVKMLKTGGKLVYSTCTFSEREDEQICEYLTDTLGLICLKEEKLYPHKIKGEGHYATLFEKKSDGGVVGVRELKANASKAGEKEYRDFEKKFFKEQFAFNLYEAGGILYELPQNCFDFRRLNVLRAGVRLGELTGGRFEPSHSLAMCLKPEECKRVVNFSVDSVETEKFLRGETVESEIENGWCLVCVDDFPIGFGKCVNGTIKNHIPKALRKRSS